MKNNIDISDYSKDCIEAVKSSDFLPSEDWTALMEMKDELQETFEKKQIWRTETEMRISVLNDVKFPTAAAKYWQSVREQSVFFENLVQLSFDYRKNLVEMRKLNKKIKEEKDEDEKELLEIELEEKMYAKKVMETAAKDRMRELKLWSKIKKELDDGTFDTKNVDTHQLVSYGQRFLKEAPSFLDGASGSERRNLIGQIQTTLRIAEEKGVKEEVLSVLPATERMKLLTTT